jgi:hypothetical protein
MKILSVNVGRPHPISWEGRVALSGIYKNPVDGPVKVRTLNLDGDQQADLSVHGGVHKAVYAYPSEHYPFWQSLYPARTLEWGAFGENLTTEGLLESSAGVGDMLQIGTAILVVVQPRLPCYKLAAKFQDAAFWNGLSSRDAAASTSQSKKKESFRQGLQQSGFFGGKIPSPSPMPCACITAEMFPSRSSENALKVKQLPDSWRKRIEAQISRNNL